MDVSDIGKRDLGTPFTLCCKAQELRFQQHVNPKACRLWLLRGKKKAVRDQAGFLQKTLFPSIHLNLQLLCGLSSFTPSSIPNERRFFKPMGANKTSLHQLEVSKSK